jgi:hypothetical protein
MTTTTTSAEFGDRVRAVLAALPMSGVVDRFAANDVLLDLLDVAGSEEEQARVMRALGDLPTSNVVDRAELNALLAGLCGQN